MISNGIVTASMIEGGAVGAVSFIGSEPTQS